MKYLKALRSRFKPKACGNQNLQFGELTMAKPDFSKIPASKEASPRQISAIANRFAKLTNPEDSWMLTKKYTAVLYRFQKESGKNLTHGDIQKFLRTLVTCSVPLKRLQRSLQSLQRRLRLRLLRSLPRHRQKSLRLQS